MLLFPLTRSSAECRNTRVVGFRRLRQETIPLALSSLYRAVIRQTSVSFGPHFSKICCMEGPKPPSTRSFLTQRARSGLDLKAAANARA